MSSDRQQQRTSSNGATPQPDIKFSLLLHGAVAIKVWLCQPCARALWGGTSSGSHTCGWCLGPSSLTTISVAFETAAAAGAKKQLEHGLVELTLSSAWLWFLVFGCKMSIWARDEDLLCACLIGALKYPIQHTYFHYQFRWHQHEHNLVRHWWWHLCCFQNLGMEMISVKSRFCTQHKIIHKNKVFGTMGITDDFTALQFMQFKN